MELLKNDAPESRRIDGCHCISCADNGAMLASVAPPRIATTEKWDLEAMIAARRGFLAHGNAPASVPQPILRSWQRSARHGLDLETKLTVEPVSGHEMREALERNELLVQAAWAEIEALCREIEAPGGVVVLTDPDGFVLSRCGSPAFLGEADELALRPGVLWNEAVIGTNAIGMALVERSEITVFGGEHFFKSHGILSCSAVPIIDSVGATIGVLDLSTVSSVSHHYALSLLRRAAEQIERRLFEQTFACQERMHLHSNPLLLGGPREGVIAFDGDRLVGANRHAIELLGLDWSAIGMVRFNQLFAMRCSSVRRNAFSDECVVQTTGGTTLFARLQTPGAGNKPNDSAIRTKPGPDTRKPVATARRPAEKSYPLPHEILERLLHGSPSEHHSVWRPKAGSLIYGSEITGEAGEAILIVRSGQMRTYSSYEGKELTLFFLGVGDAIIIHPQTMLEVKADSEIIILHESMFRELAQSEPDLGLSVMPAMNRILQKSIRMLEDLAFHSVKHRLVRLLADMAERDGRKSSRGILIESIPNAEDLAMQVGSTRQTVSTIIAELVRRGILQRAGKSSIVIPDLERLSDELEAA